MGGSRNKSGPPERIGAGNDRVVERPGARALEKARPGLFPFLSFRYSFRSMTAGSDGKAHMRAAEHRFENGKLESEEFEATADLKDYFEFLNRLQQKVFDQFTSFMRPFLPPSGKHKK